MSQSQLDIILQRKVTRRQFLLSLVGVFAALFGISAIMGALTKGTDVGPRNPGYGKRHYGP